VIEQEPLKGPGDVANILDHPAALRGVLAAPLQQQLEPLTPRRDRPLRHLHPELAYGKRRVRLLVRIHPDRQHPIRPFR
jgi:hypothetical protein